MFVSSPKFCFIVSLKLAKYIGNIKCFARIKLYYLVVTVHQQ